MIKSHGQKIIWLILDSVRFVIRSSLKSSYRCLAFVIGSLAPRFNQEGSVFDTSYLLVEAAHIALQIEGWVEVCVIELRP